MEYTRTLKSFRTKVWHSTKMEKNIWYYEMSELGYNYRITDIQGFRKKSIKKINKFLKQEIKLLNFITKVFPKIL